VWKFETRQCLCTVRIPNTCNLHALDFGWTKTSFSLIAVAGDGDEPTGTVVSVYNATNAGKGSLELIGRASTPVLISHLRFLSSELTTFISIGSDNLHVWTIQQGNELKSRHESINENDASEYTDLQFERLSSSQWRKSVVYIATNTGHVLEYSDVERRVLRRHQLAEKISKTDHSSLNISVLACTDHFCVTGSSDGRVRVWSKEFSQVYIEAKYDHAITGLVVSHDQTRVLISTKSSLLGVLNLLSKIHRDLSHAHTKSLTDIDYDHRREQFTSVGQDGTIRVWNSQTGQLITEFTSERDIPVMVAYTPDRRSFACGFNSGRIQLFDLTTSRPLLEVK
jgi:WD40 repeat protein